MSSTNFSDDFKRDAVAQITERGYPVREVAERLGVSQYSLYSWKKKFAKASSGDAEKEAEIRRLKRELLRVTEERDILKKPSRVAARLCAVATACATLWAKGSCRSLIGGTDPVKKRGTWADAHLRVVTARWRRSRLGR